MRVLILGGTGAAGQSLVRHLRTGDAHAHVTVISRTATALPYADRVLTGHFARLAGLPDFHRQLAETDAVVHLADGLSILQHPPFAADLSLAEQLIAATEMLARAARAARVPLMVHVSSIKALCDEADDRVLVETSALRATTLYGRAKGRLEQRLAATLAGSETRLAIVRNPVMYGETKPGSIARLMRLADTPWPLPFDGIANRRSLLAVDNLASALAAILATGPGALDRADEHGNIFHVHDGPALSTTEIVAILRSALGRRRRLFRAGALTAGTAGRLPLIGPAVRRLYGSLELSDDRFRRRFRWRPAIDSREELCRTARAIARRL